jgi:hypothetical protein
VQLDGSSGDAVHPQKHGLPVDKVSLHFDQTAMCTTFFHKTAHLVIYCHANGLGAG